MDSIQTVGTDAPAGEERSWVRLFSFVSGALLRRCRRYCRRCLGPLRSGAETCAMAADIANDVWDNMRDTYEHKRRGGPCCGE